MNWFCTRLVMVVVLLAGALAGCDIAPTERVNQEGALGEPNPGNLDPELDANLTAYFYAGKPVSGLLYSCTKEEIVEYSGSTDENGQFICPRDTRANFYVGVVRESTLKIGQVDLSIFGSEASVLRRNNVVITPATLFGTHVSPSRKEIVNIFNLIYSLDASDPDSTGQEIIQLKPEVLSVVIRQPAFELMLADKGVRAIISLFDSRLTQLIEGMGDMRSQLTLGEPLGETAAVQHATVAMHQSRAGLYRTATALIDALPSEVLVAQADIYVAVDGSVSGVAFAEVRNPASSNFKDPLSMRAGARILADGTLEGLVFGSGVDAVSVFGTIINNMIWGESKLCDVNNPNELIPAIYCTSDPSDGGFTIGDGGRFHTPQGFDGEMVMMHPVAGRPDFDVDELPVNFNLPRTYELTLGKYPAIEPADFFSEDYDEVHEDKDAFGSTLAPLAAKLRYTLMKNGDLVSDVDRDCAALSFADGRYVDEDGDQEFIIGRMGSVFTRQIPNTGGVSGVLETDTFIDFYINILDEGHPQFGLTIGMDAMFRSSLHEMLLQVSPNSSRTDKIRSKSCDPTSRTICNHKVEWFDNVQYWRNVYAIDQSTPTSVTPVDEANYLNVPYYGQLMDNALVHTSGEATAICAAAVVP